MIDKLIAFALNQRAVTLLFTIVIVTLGVYSIYTIPNDSFPDVSNVQVQIITEPESMAAEEVESLVTVPIEYALNGLPFVQKVRSSSEFGLSVVTAIFDDNCDVYFARQLVQQRLTTLNLPEAKPQLGPVVSSFSQVFMYYVTSDRHNLIDLRTLQDWFIAKRLLSVQGVGNVVSYGGFVKQYQVIVDQTKIRSFGLTVTEILNAISASNRNVGGNFIEVGDEEVIIRGLGRVNNIEDIGLIPLREVAGTPVYVRDVASVVVAPAFRRGSASKDGEGETIMGIVLTRKGANTKQVVENVELKLKELEHKLPPGVKITPYYNQKELVDKTADTVREILLMSGGLVIVILTAIIMHIPTALIVAVIIPLSLLFSFFLMKFTGLSSNLMTLGAVDFGVVVDAGVVMAENIFRKLSLAYEESNSETIDRMEVIKVAAQEVGRPIAFSIMIIVAVYLPLFALEGIEGKMFQPLALTFIYAIVGALLISLTTIPLLCFWFLRNRIVEKHNPFIEWTKARYAVALAYFLAAPKKIITVSLVVLVASFLLIPFLGSEFMPTLDEGPVLLRMRMPPSISHTSSIETVMKVEKLLRQFPETTIAIAHIGRSGMGSDIEGVDAGDLYIGLKPKSEWKDRNKEHLVERMAEAVEPIPGVLFSFSQPIADMIDDLLTGIKADVGIKIYGDDLTQLERLASQVMTAVRKVRGSGDVSREPVLGSPQLKISLNRRELARHNLLIEEVHDVIETALAGKVASQVVEDNKRFDILVRFDKKYRDSAAAIGDIIIRTKSGAELPLRSIADIKTEKGALLIMHENAQRRAAVMVNIRERDLGSWVQEAKQVLAKEVQLPPGYSFVWGGQFENQERAMTRLCVVVPIVLFLIFILLFFTFHSAKNAALIMLNVPFATIGGIVGLWLSHQPVSVPAIIGFIAVFGVAVQNGVILVSYFKQLEQSGQSTQDAITNGAYIRLRPVLMTGMVAMMGLLPKLFFDGTGAEIQRPMATVIFGGLLTATTMTLLVLPSIYKLINSAPTKPSGPDHKFRTFFRRTSRRDKVQPSEVHS